MNRLVKSFLDDSSFVLIENKENCYIFIDQKTMHKLKVEVLNDDKILVEFLDVKDE